MQPHNTDTKPGYEQRDVDTSAVFRPALGLFVLIVFSLVAMWWTLRLFDWQASRGDRPLTPVAREAGPALPPEPRLQTSPPADLREMRAAEDAVLKGYAWVDRERGIVRIPVARAMEILAERGLPARAEERR